MTLQDSPATQHLHDVVVPAADARAMLTAAAREDVSVAGCFSPGPSGIQLWDSPWNGPLGRVGTAQHLGSVDWTWDTPVAHYVSIYRVLVTPAGIRYQLTPQELLEICFALGGVQAPGIPKPRQAP